MERTKRAADLLQVASRLRAEGRQAPFGNSRQVDLELIEVQTGSYLGEDDIERMEDDYHRS
jgi:hypothetical protein